jgi:hypothetical protein
LAQGPCVAAVHPERSNPYSALLFWRNFFENVAPAAKPDRFTIRMWPVLGVLVDNQSTDETMQVPVRTTPDAGVNVHRDGKPSGAGRFFGGMFLAQKSPCSSKNWH